MELKVTELRQAGKDSPNLTAELYPTLETNRKYEEQEKVFRWSNGNRYETTRWRRNSVKNSPAGKTIIYVSVDGEGLWDDFENRTSRPHTLWAEPIKNALIAAGWPSDVKLRWSQKAGCSCPCSPGFFVTGGHTGLDLWATIAADTVQSDNPEEAAMRRAALVNDPTIPVSA